jgi:hypothetical protein
MLRDNRWGCCLNSAKSKSPEALEILLRKVGLNSDIVSEIRKWLPKCDWCNRGALTTPIFRSAFWHHGGREHLEFISTKYEQAHPGYARYKNHISTHSVCYKCRIAKTYWALKCNYNWRSLKHDIDDKIKKFALYDRRLHESIIEVFRMELEEKLWLYMARYNYLSGQPSRCKRKYWQWSCKYTDKRLRSQSDGLIK